MELDPIRQETGNRSARRPPHRRTTASHPIGSRFKASMTPRRSTIAPCRMLPCRLKRLKDFFTSESCPFQPLRPVIANLATEAESLARRWWSVFWDVFRAKAGKGGTISARAFVEASTQAVDLGLSRNPSASQVSCSRALRGYSTLIDVLTGLSALDKTFSAPLPTSCWPSLSSAAGAGLRAISSSTSATATHPLDWATAASATA